MQINRTFTHRTFGPIGTAKFTCADGKFTLDGQPLPDASAEYLLTFSLQALQDAYAGAKTADEARASFDKKRKALLTGSFGRAARAGEEPHMPYVRRIIRAALSIDNKAKYEKTDEKARVKFLSGLFAGLDDAKRGQIEKAAKSAYQADLAAKKAVKVELTI